MDCIKCNSSQVRVIDTRAKGTRRIYRRRVCMMCGFRWTTVELPVGDVRQAVDAVNGLEERRGKKHTAKIKSATCAASATICAPRAAWRSTTSYSGADGASCLSGTASRSGCATTITMSRPWVSILTPVPGGSWNRRHNLLLIISMAPAASPRCLGKKFSF